MVTNETLEAWVKDCDSHIESGVATDLVVVCPVALRAFAQELLSVRGAHKNEPSIEHADGPCDFQFEISPPKNRCLNCGWMVQNHRIWV